MTNTIISDMRQKAQEQPKESPLSFWLNHYADLIEDAQTASVRNCDRVRCPQAAALAPVLKVNLDSLDIGVGVSDCIQAVQECQRIYNESEVK